MKFKIESWSIQNLLSLLEKKQLNLNPPYQRNDIWSLPAKKRLIESIKLGYPLPAFFLFKKNDDTYEMVDGQQRTRAIRGYISGVFPDFSKSKFVDNADSDYFLNQYQLPIVIISNILEHESLEDFYYRVNKFGTKLNRPEIIKAQYFDTPFQSLVESLAYSDNFQKLKLFSESSLDRMQDLDFVAELLTLLKVGIYEKKHAVDELYESNLSKDELFKLEKQFYKVLSIIEEYNKVYPIHHTRYKQRNDFYTLFGFLNKNINLKKDILDYFYRILVAIGNDIYPTNEECYAFQDYAIKCVSQSNSKKARKDREKFFKLLLLNKDPNPLSKKGTDEANDVLIDVIEYYKINNNFHSIVDYYLLPVEEILSKEKIKLNTGVK